MKTAKTKSCPHQQAQSSRPFTAADVRLMFSNPMYAYGINLLPTERVAEEVMRRFTPWQAVA